MTNKKPPQNGNIYRNKIKTIITTNYCFIFKNMKINVIRTLKKSYITYSGRQNIFCMPF